MNKDQIKIKLKTLPFFKGDIDLKFIEGFMTNDSYHLMIAISMSLK